MTRHLCAAHTAWVDARPYAVLHRDTGQPCDSEWYVNEHGRRRPRWLLLADAAEAAQMEGALT